MRRYLQRPEDWQRWHAILAERPGSEETTGASALFLLQQFLEDGLTDQQAIEHTLRSFESHHSAKPDPAEQHNSRSIWLLPSAALLIAAGLLIGVQIQPLLEQPSQLPEPLYRGVDEQPPAGVLHINIDGVSLGEVPLGSGLRPTLAPGETQLTWESEETDVAVWGWASDDRTPVELTTEPFLVSGTDGTTVVIAVVKRSWGDPSELVESVGDGRGVAIGGLGGARIIALDFKSSEPK